MRTGAGDLGGGTASSPKPANVWNLGSQSALNVAEKGAVVRWSPTSAAGWTVDQEATVTILTLLAPHLPYLRRYARALTGDQATGDQYVRVALEALAAGEIAIGDATPPRVGLYQVFHAIWCSSGARLESRRDETDEDQVYDASQRLMRLAPSSRPAFLLTAIEGFRKDETAAILGASVDQVDGLIANAQQEIDACLATSVLIIEDEAVIAADIEALVEGLGHTVVGIARTRDESMNAIAEHKPGLVLADIQLADGSSGIDAVRDILAEIDVPVIFITAFPDRLLTGERPEPTYLITKPFQVETLKACIYLAMSGTLSLATRKIDPQGLAGIVESRRRRGRSEALSTALA